MIIKVNGVQRKLGWTGTSVHYGFMAQRPMEEAVVARSSNNEAILAPIADIFIEDQGAEGSCATFSAIYACRWLQLKLKLPAIDLSKQYLYNKVRHKIHTWPTDSGSTMTDVTWTLHKIGVCRESLWPYIAGEYDKEPPSPKCDQDAPKHIVIDTYRIPFKQTALNQLVKRGPFICGIVITNNFPGVECDGGILNPDDGSGKVPMPSDGIILGGHGICVMDFSLDPRTYIRGGRSVTVPYAHLVSPNSWGLSWGHNGWMYLPIEYMGSVPTNGGHWPLMSEMIEILKEKDLP